MILPTYAGTMYTVVSVNILWYFVEILQSIPTITALFTFKSEYHILAYKSPPPPKTSSLHVIQNHSKLDYCNSLYYNLPKSQINCLQQNQNCLACTVVKAPKSSHITPTLRSLHWLNINERIEYKLLSLTYKVLTISQPVYLHNLISVQSSRRTRSPSAVEFPITNCVSVKHCG